MHNVLFRCTFPFEGNWNFFGAGLTTQELDVLSMHFPVWRELKLRWKVFYSEVSTLPFDALSRLKGIETDKRTRTQNVDMHFRCTFPFEGNWNDDVSNFVTRLSTLSMHFPVWRELKPKVRVYRRLRPAKRSELSMHFPVWRELKRRLHTAPTLHISLSMHFPVWRELKLIIPVAYRIFDDKVTFDALSRLKGIETRCSTVNNLRCSLLSMHFPVWRELKRKNVGYSLSCRTSLLSMHFPVWRELKHDGEDSNRSDGFTFRCTFPFEGNWNASVHSIPVVLPIIFRCTFPFEGNWNSKTRCCTRTCSCFRCAFPFEGNWNGPMPTSPNTPDFHFRCAFPFEGNWNIDYEIQGSGTTYLSMCFPVWRELKPTGWVLDNGKDPDYLSMCFPVWRELKLRITSHYRQIGLVSFRCAFPFEGNWNRWYSYP